VKYFPIILLGVFIYPAIISAKASFHHVANQKENNRPVVKIINPKNNSSINNNALVNYSITVSDKEDGDSKYDEINAKEVLLEVTHITDTTELHDIIDQPIQNDAAGLTAIRTSNCFNCHAFDSKVIGPSFRDIGKKYKTTAANIALLQKRILEGSTGVWSNVAMPSHPELNKQQALDMVEWILKIANDNNTNYFIGIEGSFHMSAVKGTYLLSASYVDHGLPNQPAQRIKGEDKIIINSR
jgi:cytochrome c